MTRFHRPQRLIAALVAALTIIPLTGCASIEDLTGLSLSPGAAGTAAAGETSGSNVQEHAKQSTSGESHDELGRANAEDDDVFDSQFSKNGVSNVYKNIAGIDYVLSIFPSQATPRSDQWYPKGDKLFTFTFQAYDLNVDLKAPYASKRLVYLGNVNISSDVTLSGHTESSARSPYTVNGQAASLTFDPEPNTFRSYGMRITSPKGVYEMRNQVIGDLPDESIGITLHFKFYVTVQRAAGQDAWDAQEIDIDIPIGIFESDEPTPIRDVPVDAA